MNNKQLPWQAVALVQQGGMTEMTNHDHDPATQVTEVTYTEGLGHAFLKIVTSDGYLLVEWDASQPGSEPLAD